MAKKSRLDSISVPKPCHEDWNKMNGGEKSRFCGICEKNVYNISAMTPREADKLLFENTEKVCIRMEKDAHGKVKTLKNQLHQITRQAPIAAGVLSLTLAFSAIAGAQEKSSPIIPNRIYVVKNSGFLVTPTVISGVVADISGAVIPNVEVTLRDMKENSIQKTVSDAEGKYQFSNLKTSVYQLDFEASQGFKKLTFENIKVEDDDILLYVALDAGEVLTGVVAIASSEELVQNEPPKIEDAIQLKPIINLPSSNQKFFLGLTASSINKPQNQTSQISFTVIDSFDALVINAKLVLKNQKSKKKFTASTNESGNVKFGNLPIGNYKLRVSADGYKTKEISLTVDEKTVSNQEIIMDAVLVTVGMVDFK